MPFFDVNNVAHLAKIPTALRTHSELEFVATQAELDVISYFTFMNAEGTDTEVCLRGYDDDVTQCDAALKTAIINEIAAVISWRLQTGAGNVSSDSNLFDNMRRVTHGRRTVEYRSAADNFSALKDAGLYDDDPSLPNPFPRYLMPYATGSAQTYLS